MPTAYSFLLPEPDEETRPWWDAVRRHELMVQRCGDCRWLRHPPQGVCPRCQGEKVEWARVSGRGTLYSYIVIHRPVLSQFLEAAPYNVVQVEIEEAPHVRMFGNVVGVEDSRLRVGMPLEIVYDDVAPGETIPRWRERET